jgi:hypothetical protein
LVAAITRTSTPHRVRVANALELPLLQDAEQLRLQRHAHRAHFIEEERAAVRLLDAPLARADSSRECSPHVSEELCFEQRLGDRTAVDRDEPLRAPGAVVVDRARHHLLPCAGFTRHEDRAGGRGDRFEQLEEVAHCAAAPDDSFEPIALLELRTKVRVFRLESPLFERRVQRVHQLFELERLGDEIRGASLDDAHGVAHGAVARDDNRDDVGIALDGRVDDLHAVDAGQAQVGDDDVEGELGERIDRTFPCLRLDNDKPVVFETLGYRLPQRRLVFDEEQMGCGLRHLRGVSILTAGSRGVKVNLGSTAVRTSFRYS